MEELCLALQLSFETNMHRLYIQCVATVSKVTNPDADKV